MDDEKSYNPSGNPGDDRELRSAPAKQAGSVRIRIRSRPRAARGRRSAAPRDRRTCRSGAERRALKVGDVAPAFTLPDPDGAPVSSEALLTRGPLVVTFYRGAWCPFCNFDLSASEEARPDIESRGATLVAISQQTAANSRKSQRQNGLGIPILGDHCGEIADRFGLRWTLPDYLRDVQKALGADLTLFNGEDSWTLPMPARYVVAPNGRIAYAEVNADYTRRPEPSSLFPILETLSRRQDA